MSKRGQISGWAIIGIGFLIVLIGISVIYILSPKKEEPKIQNETYMNMTYFKIYITTNANKPIEYELWNDTSLLVKGLITNSNIIEQYEDVANGSLLKLSAWGGNHYYNESICNVTVNQTYCHINLVEKANDYEIFINSSYLKIDTFGKTIQNPMICWAFAHNVLNVRMDLQWIQVPDNLKSSVDVCYQGKTFNETRVFEIQIMPNKLVESMAGVVIVKIMDYECCSKSNIGLKDKSISFRN